MLQYSYKVLHYKLLLKSSKITSQKFKDSNLHKLSISRKIITINFTINYQFHDKLQCRKKNILAIVKVTLILVIILKLSIKFTLRRPSITASRTCPRKHIILWCVREVASYVNKLFHWGLKFYDVRGKINVCNYYVGFVLHDLRSPGTLNSRKLGHTSSSPCFCCESSTLFVDFLCNL